MPIPLPGPRPPAPATPPARRHLIALPRGRPPHPGSEPHPGSGLALAPAPSGPALEPVHRHLVVFSRSRPSRLTVPLPAPQVTRLPVAAPALTIAAPEAAAFVPAAVAPASTFMPVADEDPQAGADPGAADHRQVIAVVGALVAILALCGGVLIAFATALG